MRLTQAVSPLGISTEMTARFVHNMPEQICTDSCLICRIYCQMVFTLIIQITFESSLCFTNPHNECKPCQCYAMLSHCHSVCKHNLLLLLRCICNTCMVRKYGVKRFEECGKLNHGDELCNTEVLDMYNSKETVDVILRGWTQFLNGCYWLIDWMIEQLYFCHCWQCTIQV